MKEIESNGYFVSVYKRLIKVFDYLKMLADADVMFEGMEEVKKMRTPKQLLKIMNEEEINNLSARL